MDEKVSFEKVLHTAAGFPMVKVDRTEFLQSALSLHFDGNTVNRAISVNPAHAGIPAAAIKKIADASIRYETFRVSALSFAAGIPGGPAMFGTVPADFIQYFGHVLRILQKLLYLYGWPELFDGHSKMDDATANLLTLFVGVMFGVNGAANAIVRISESAAQRAARTLAQKALTQGTVYPVVKKVAAALGVKMTKEVFAKGVSKFIPVVGGIASGGVTYATFLPMAIKLRNHLSALKFADEAFYRTNTANPENGIVADDFVETEPEL